MSQRIFSKLFQRRLRLFILLVLLSVNAGMLDLYFNPSPHEADHFTGVLHGGINWLIGASLLWYFELFLVPGPLGAPIRRLHFAVAILVKGLVWCFIVAFTSFAGQWLLHDKISLAFLQEPEFYRVVGFVLIVAGSLQVITQIVRIIGGRTLVKFILGRYHRPVREERIFMFLDLANSTAVTEQLGDLGAQTLITQFFFDITEPIIEHSGEIHRYVGDQVVVTWPLGTEEANRAVIDCYFDIQRAIARKANRYQKRFNLVPEFRVGLHGGPVVVSECGDQKQEISYFGDTINTAARVEQQCKPLSTPMLISSELLERIALPSHCHSKRISQVRLRGRDQDTELYTVLAS